MPHLSLPSPSGKKKKKCNEIRNEKKNPTKQVPTSRRTSPASYDIALYIRRRLEKKRLGKGKKFMRKCGKASQSPHVDVKTCIGEINFLGLDGNMGNCNL